MEFGQNLSNQTRAGCMSKYLLMFALCRCGALWSQEQFELAPPYVEYSSSFFKDSVRVQMHFAMQGSEIRYTLNGAEPGLQDSVYRGPIFIKEPETVVKARVFAEGYRPSATTSAILRRGGIPLKSITGTQPNPKYAGNGIGVLIDHQCGEKSFRNASWLGFTTDTLNFQIVAQQKTRISSVLLETMQDQAAWIFMPSLVEVFGIKKDASLELIGRLSISSTIRNDVKDLATIQVPIKSRKAYRQFIVKVTPLQQLPDWHAGKGSAAWVFLDEIMFYK